MEYILNKKQREFLEGVSKDELLNKYLSEKYFPDFREGLDVAALKEENQIWTSINIKRWLSEILENNEYDEDDIGWIDSVRILYGNKDKIK